MMHAWHAESPAPADVGFAMNTMIYNLVLFLRVLAARQGDFMVRLASA